MERYEILEKFIKENNFKTIAEIGVSGGVTAKYLIERCKLDKYYLIDPDPIGVFNYKFFSSRPEVVFLRLYSNQAVNCIKDNELDLVFIDADHGYESVNEDIKLWSPKVRNGGIICGHDYSLKTPGVIKAVKENFKDFNLLPNLKQDSDKVWWLFKSI